MICVPARWLAAAAILAPAAVLAQASMPESFFAKRPAFSPPEQAASKPAACETLQSQLPADVPADTRVDLAIVGPVSLVQTDGVLWYVAVCPEPGLRVMCVTYDNNGLKLGDRAILRGGYNRQDARHVMLDPCLASPDRGED